MPSPDDDVDCPVCGAAGGFERDTTDSLYEHTTVPDGRCGLCEGLGTVTRKVRDEYLEE